jgi:hypothetical protein
MRFESELNAHDISWAISYCENRQIPYSFFDLNLQSFFESGECFAYAEASQCGYPFMLVHFKMMEALSRQIGGVILGNGDLHFAQVQGRWQNYRYEFWSSYEKFCFSKRLPNVVKFFGWSPELILSYMANPRMMEILSNSKFHLSELSPLKQEIYGDFFKFSSRRKFRGYDKVPFLQQRFSQILQEKYQFSNQYAALWVSDLLEHLYPRELKLDRGIA